LFGRFVIFAKGIRQTGIGMGRYIAIGNFGQGFDIGPEFFGAKSAVKPD
jgi:hypothetical protein